MTNTNPNMDGIKNYQTKKQELIRNKIFSTIKKLKKEKKEINIQIVAKIAGVSTVTIYKYTDLANIIKTLRDKKINNLKKTIPLPYQQTEVINQGLQMKVQELLKENTHLKKRIEVQNGIIQELENSSF